MTFDQWKETHHGWETIKPSAYLNLLLSSLGTVATIQRMILSVPDRDLLDVVRAYTEALEEHKNLSEAAYISSQNFFSNVKTEEKPNSEGFILTEVSGKSSKRQKEGTVQADPERSD